MMSYVVCGFVFFFKKKTAYELRISDWSSDVCSSDLLLKSTIRRQDQVRSPRRRCDAAGVQRMIGKFIHRRAAAVVRETCALLRDRSGGALVVVAVLLPAVTIGRASCWERVCQYV